MESSFIFTTKEQNSDGYLKTNGEIEWNSTKLSKRLGRYRFENEECLKCQLLPVCFGPCSQKVIETDKRDFKMICNFEGLNTSIHNMLKRFYYEEYI